MKRLPIDVSSFPELLEGSYAYVDKTKIIYDLVTNGKFYLLARPRRFGKSLFVSTLKQIFEGNRELFKDLWLGSSKYDWPTHPVIALDFSDLDIESPQDVKMSLSKRLQRVAKYHEVKLDHNDSVGTMLIDLVDELSEKNKVVILIDEYGVT